MKSPKQTNSSNHAGPRRRYRLAPILRTKPTSRSVVYIAASTLTVCMLCMIVFLNSNPKNAFAAVNHAGDFRSATSGNWGSASTWEHYDGTTWGAAITFPNNNSSTIQIQSGHTVTVTANVTVDQLTIDAGAVVTVNAGKTVTVNKNGPGDDIVVNGILNVYGTMNNQTTTSIQLYGIINLKSGGVQTISAGAVMNVNNGGRYIIEDASCTSGANIWVVYTGGTIQYNVNGGNIPDATWGTGSTCEVTGITNTKPGHLDQSFYNFTWNCPNQTDREKFAAKLTDVSGDFNVISTGTGEILLSRDEDYVFNIGGNYNHQGGEVSMTCKATHVTINVAGDFSQSGGTFNGTDVEEDNGEGKPVMNVTGNFLLSAGEFDMSEYNGNSATKGFMNLNLYGNCTQTGGTLTENAVNTGKGTVNFKKTGTQTYTRTSGTQSNLVHYSISSGSIVDAGTGIFSSSGNFTLASGAGFIMAHTAGITQTSANGQVQVTGTRSYNTGADYTYNAASAQVSGDGLPATVHNLTKNNSGDLTLTNTVSVSNNLYLTNGVIKTGSNELISTNTNVAGVSGYSSSSYVIGNLRRSVSSTGTYDFPLGSTSNYELMSVTLTSIAGFSNLLSTFVPGHPAPGGLAVPLVYNGRYFNKMLDHGYWTLDPNSNITSGSYGVAISGTGYTNSSQMSITAASDVMVLKRHSSAEDWDIMGSPDHSKESMTGNTIVSACNGLTTFSHFGQGGGGSTLPIKLLSFNVKLKENTVDLNWVTGTEINNDYFTVERSTDGSHYKEILRQRGAGNSTQTLNYTGNDDSPLTGYNYYRLKQTDFDGHYSYSSVRTVRLKSKPGESPDLNVESVYPNPFRETFKLDFTVMKSANVNIIVYNQTGQTVSEEKFEANEGNNTYEFFDDDNLAKGVYFVAIIKDEQKIIKRIIKN